MTERRPPIDLSKLPPKPSDDDPEKPERPVIKIILRVGPYVIAREVKG
jgi:hypothetical protein